MKPAIRNRTLWAAMAVQAIFAGLILWDIVSSILGLRARPVSWQLREVLEIVGVLGMLLGLAFGMLYLRRAEAERQRAEEQLSRARTAFNDVLEDRFSDWGLTPAERDVALFSLKGMSIQEIAGLRDTSEGTVKAQSNAIYRKAGVSGRAQLLSLFIDDLMAD